MWVTTKMTRIAIVEDEKAYKDLLLSCLHRYEQEHDERFQIITFEDGIDILESNFQVFDIILMDIQMKHLNGMKTAERIRQADKNVIIIFITNLAQYALQGYRVRALDYILKPIQYFAFSQTLQEALNRIQLNTTSYLHFTQKGSIRRLDSAAITYIEAHGHDIIIHTKDGEITTREPLKEMEQKLDKQSFVRCNKCYLVNLAHVERVVENTVVVAGEELQISRPKRKSFVDAIAAYMGGTGGWM